MQSRVLRLAAACSLPLAFARPALAGTGFGPDPTLPFTRKLIRSIDADELRIRVWTARETPDHVTFKAVRPRAYSGEGPTVEGTLDLGEVPGECDPIGGLRFAESAVYWPRDSSYVGREPDPLPQPEPEQEPVAEEAPRPRPQIEYFPSGRTDTLFPLKGPIYCLKQEGGGPGGDLRSGYGRSVLPTCSRDRAALERELEEAAKSEERRRLAHIEGRRMEREAREHRRRTIERCTVHLDVRPDPDQEGHFRVRAERDGTVIAEVSPPNPTRTLDYEAVALLPVGLACDALGVALYLLCQLVVLGLGL